MMQSIAYASHHNQDGHKTVNLEPTETTENYQVYGDPWLTNEQDIIGLAEGIKSLDSQKQNSKTYIGQVTQVCQKMGCWMILTDEEMFARVAFNDHAFFVPKDSQGKALVYGQLYEKKLSEEQRAHFESEGSGPLPEVIYEITAFSVKLFN